jgi:hypothetical protein
MPPQSRGHERAGHLDSGEGHSRERGEKIEKGLTLFENNNCLSDKEITINMISEKPFYSIFFGILIVLKSLFYFRCRQFYSLIVASFWRVGPALVGRSVFIPRFLHEKTNVEKEMRHL